MPLSHNSLQPPLNPDESLRLPVNTPTLEVLGYLATKIEANYINGGEETLSPEERYTGYVLTDELSRDLSKRQYLPDRPSQNEGYIVTNRFDREVEAAKKEGISDLIVAANTAAMESPEMRSVLEAESVGGGAGTFRIYDDREPNAETNGSYACAIVRGYANEYGLIIAFGNPQYVDPVIKARSEGFSLKILLGRLDYSEGTPREIPDGRIVEVSRVRGESWDHENKLSEKAFDRIFDAAKYYNDHYLAKRR